MNWIPEVCIGMITVFLLCPNFQPKPSGLIDRDWFEEINDL